MEIKSGEVISALRFHFFFFFPESWSAGFCNRAVKPGPVVTGNIPARMIRVNDAEQAIYGFVFLQLQIAT